jgi:hypothetical protein
MPPDPSLPELTLGERIRRITERRKPQVMRFSAAFCCTRYFEQEASSNTTGGCARGAGAGSGSGSHDAAIVSTATSDAERCVDAVDLAPHAVRPRTRSAISFVVVILLGRDFPWNRCSEAHAAEIAVFSGG